MGYDLSIFLHIGQAVLAGLNPYAVHDSMYPPAMTMLFVIFAWMPPSLLAPLWMAFNAFLLVDGTRRQKQPSIPWLFFTPVLFMFMTGQIDIPFYWLTTHLKGGKRTAILCAALLTLKPQIALVVLPPVLLRWFREDRRCLAQWFAALAIIHSLPLLYNLHIYEYWLASLTGPSHDRIAISSGVFSFPFFAVSPIFAYAVVLGVAVWAAFQEEGIARAAILLASPVNLWYDNILLIGIIPWQIFVPLSLATFAAAALLQNSFPFIFLPLTSLVYLITKQKNCTLSSPCHKKS